MWHPSILPGAWHYATAPTPILIADALVRVFVSCRDKDMRSYVFSFDIDVSRDPQIVTWTPSPLIAPGQRGSFSCDGVLATSVVKGDATALTLYFAGFQRQDRVPYRIMSGSVMSTDHGQTFTASTLAPLKLSTPSHYDFQGGPFAYRQQNQTGLFYLGGTWKRIHDEFKPSYALYHAMASSDSSWRDDALVMPSTPRFTAIGRPWRHEPINFPPRLLVSVRDRVSRRYRMGEIKTGDNGNTSLSLGIGLEPHEERPAINDTTFAATIESGGRLWCFYNGDQLGRDGVLLAEMQ